MNKDLVKDAVYDAMIGRVNKVLTQFDNEIISALDDRANEILKGNILSGYKLALKHVSESLNGLIINLEKVDV